MTITSRWSVHFWSYRSVIQVSITSHISDLLRNSYTSGVVITTAGFPWKEKYQPITALQLGIKKRYYLSTQHKIATSKCPQNWRQQQIRTQLDRFLQIDLQKCLNQHISLMRKPLRCPRSFDPRDPKQVNPPMLFQGISLPLHVYGVCKSFHEKDQPYSVHHH